MPLLNTLYDPANVDTDYFVAAATGDLTDVELTLEETDTPDSLAHQLSFVSSGDISSAIFTVVGVDADGVSVTETVTGITTSPVETVKYYKTITSITGDSDISTETVDVGFVDEFVSAIIPLDWQRNVPSHWFGDQNGTITWNVDFAIEDPGLVADQTAVNWKNPAATLESETADSTAFVDVGAGYAAARVRVASYTNTADLRIYMSQPEVV